MGRRRRSRRRRSRRRNRRGGKGKGAFKRKSARHGRTDAQMRAAAARRKNKTVKKTSGNHSPGWKSGKGQVAAWRTNWKQTKRMPSARKSSSHRVTKKRSRLGAPPKGHAPPPPSQVVKAAVQAANIAANNVAQATNAAANQVATEARKCTGPGKCSTQKSANESRGLCYSYGDCLWEGRPKGGLKPISKIPKIASNNVNTATLSKKTGVSISQVKAGKQAANVAANKVVDATTSAANQAASKAPAYWCNDKGLTAELRKKGNCPPLSPGVICPPGCAPMAGGRRRNYAKPRPGPRRRRRRTRRR